MAILSLDHVQLAMPEGGEEDARCFYRDLLGVPEAPKPPHLAKRGGCWFEGPGVKLHLGVDRPFTPATKAHPGLVVSNAEELAEAIRRAGFPVVEDEPLEGYIRFYAEDPFGNRIEFMEPDR